MPYLLLILMPFAMAGGCFVLRRQTRLVALVGAAVALIELAIVSVMPVDDPARLLGTSVLLSATGQLLLVAALLVALGSLLAWTGGASGENSVPATLLVLGFVVPAALVQAPFAAALLLFAGGLTCMMLIVDLPPNVSQLLAPSAIATALKYLLVTVLGGALLLVGLGLNQAATGGISSVGSGLLLAGFGLWIGLAPFNLALPELAEETSTLVLAIVLGVFQLVALLLLVATLRAQPQLLLGSGSARPLAIGLAGLTVVGAPIFAYGAARRVIASLFTASMGQLVLGLALASPAGARSALLGVPAYALAVALICIGANMLQTRVPGRRETAEPLRERPVAAAGLIAGLLLLLGMPPLGGWMAKTVLWQAARQSGPAMLLIVVVGHLALIIAAVRLIQVLLLRPPMRQTAGYSDPTPDLRSPISDLELLPAVGPAYAPWALRGALLLLIALAVIAGLYPAPLLSRVDVAIAGLSFIGPLESTP